MWEIRDQIARGEEEENEGEEEDLNHRPRVSRKRRIWLSMRMWMRNMRSKKRKPLAP